MRPYLVERLQAEARDGAGDPALADAVAAADLGVVGQGRASELLYTGRALGGEEAERWGFFNRLSGPETVLADALELARALADGPTFANALTKRQLHKEWDMGLDEAIESEAQAQAIAMQTEDFARAYRAFVAKVRPVFEGD